jgi:hypothetical protein
MLPAISKAGNLEDRRAARTEPSPSNPMMWLVRYPRTARAGVLGSEMRIFADSLDRAAIGRE